MPDVLTSIPAPPVLAVVWLSLTSVATLWLRRRRELTMWRLMTVVIGATYVAGVLAVTLLPMQLELGAYANPVAWYKKVNLVPLLTIDFRSFVLNVMMTIPVGILAPLFITVRTARRAALVGFVFSLTIELAQAFSNIALSSGRTGDVNDLLANTAGTVLGWYLFARAGSKRQGASFLARFAMPERGSEPAAAVAPEQQIAR